MKAIRIRKRIKSDTLKIPQLKKLVGREVELLIVATVVSGEAAAVDPRFPLRGTAYRFDEPFAPAAISDEWDANR